MEREPREIEIHSLTLVDWAPPRLTLDVECGKGTYVRTIAHDLGEGLGCGAHLAHLVRTAVGRFTAADAVPLADLLAALEEGRLGGSAVSCRRGAARPCRRSPWARRTSAGSRRESPGRQRCRGKPPEAGALVRVYSSTGELLGLAEYDAALGHYQPRKSLRARRDGDADADAAS